MKNKILENAKIITRRDSESDYEEASQYLLNYLKDNPEDTNAWLLMARIECNIPLEYPDKIIEYANKVLAYDPTNAYALLFLAYANYYLMGEIGNDTYVKLCSAYSDDPEIMAMIEVAKARYFEHSDLKNYEQFLQKSIAYSDKQQINHSMLGKLYLSQGKITEGKKLISKAIANIKRTDGKCDPASIEELFDEFYKGIKIPLWIKNELQMIA